jgi:protein-L-isoaspartate(D-aspartate) O-methyltransferase
MVKLDEQREAMAVQAQRHGLRDERVVAALRRVRRHVFVPPECRKDEDVYGDHPVGIGHGQTISQPFIVGYLAEQVGAREGMRILEVGTGCGYQAAVLAELGAEIFSVERVAALAAYAEQALEREGYGRVRVRTGDGYEGWPEEAPFDAIVVSCAPEGVPDDLVDQLADEGRMIVPVGVGTQKLVVLSKQAGKVRRRSDLAVRFVPMVPGVEFAS